MVQCQVRQLALANGGTKHPIPVKTVGFAILFTALILVAQDVVMEIPLVRWTRAWTTYPSMLLMALVKLTASFGLQSRLSELSEGPANVAMKRSGKKRKLLTLTQLKALRKARAARKAAEHRELPPDYSEPDLDSRDYPESETDTADIADEPTESVFISQQLSHVCILKQ